MNGDTPISGGHTALLIATAEVAQARLTVALTDGRVISTPLDWYPVLLAATDVDLQNFHISPFGVHWDVLDEDLGLAGMLAGQSLVG